MGQSAFPHTERGIVWANEILSGDRPAGLLAKLAVERFLRDLERQGDEDFPYYFDAEESERWLEFLGRLPHVKGKWKGQLFEPAGYQCFCTANIYGWRHTETNLRRFNEAYIEVPRKNGKSFWMAALGIGHICIDNENGAEVYCGATTEKQAWEVFRPARSICLQSPDLAYEFGIEVGPKSKSIWILQEGNVFAPVIGNPGDGPSPSCAIHDEYHEHAKSDQFDTMATGMGAREQPLQMVITTAGVDMGGPCYEKRKDCIDILKGTVDDDNLFAIIFNLDADDQWDTEEAIEKANPNLDVSVSRDYLLRRLKQAKRNPTQQSAYRTKHLNQWVGAKEAWLNMLKVQVCAKRSLKQSRFAKKRVFIGLDLASKIDIASMAMLHKQGDKYYSFMERWLPEEVAYNSGNDRYKGWAEAGLINVTDGDIIDFDVIEDRLKELKSEYQVVEVGYDPFQATQFATHMQKEGFRMVEVGQTVKNFSEPMKELQSVIYSRNFVYDGDPILTWMFGNVVAKKDKKQNIFPDKELESAKIDDVVALIIAFSRALFSKQSESIYAKTSL